MPLSASSTAFVPSQQTSIINRDSFSSYNATLDGNIRAKSVYLKNCRLDGDIGGGKITTHDCDINGDICGNNIKTTSLCNALFARNRAIVHHTAGIKSVIAVDILDIQNCIGIGTLYSKVIKATTVEADYVVAIKKGYFHHCSINEEVVVTGSMLVLRNCETPRVTVNPVDATITPTVKIISGSIKHIVTTVKTKITISGNLETYPIISGPHILLYKTSTGELILYSSTPDKQRRD